MSANGGSRGDKAGLLSAAFIAVTVVNFFDFYALSTFFLLPRHIKELGGSERMVGVIMGSTSLVNLVAIPLVGAWVDRLGRKPLMVLGSVGMMISCPLFALPSEVGWAFIGLRMAHGLSFAMFFVAAMTAVADIAPADRRAEAIGLFGVFGLATNALAPAVGEWIVGRWSFSALFVVAGASALVAAVVALLIRLPSREGAHHSELSLLDLARRAEIATPVAMSCVLATGFGAAIQFVAAFGVEAGLTGVAPFFVAFTALSIGVRVIGGRLPDRLGHRAVTVPAALVFASGLALLGQATDSLTLAVAGGLFGLGHGVTYPALSALVLTRVAAAERGKAMGLYSGAFAAGMVISAYGFGPLAQASGYAAMFTVAAAGVAAGTVLFAVGDRRAVLIP